MMFAFHPDVIATPVSATCLEIHDQRTGLHFQVEDFDDYTTTSSALSEELRKLVSRLGLYDSLECSELRRRQKSFRQELQQGFRDDALEQLLDFASNHVPYYRDRECYRLGSSEKGLYSLPILQKADLRDAYVEFLSDEVDVHLGIEKGRYSFARTSGTTGDRIQVISDLSMDRVPPDYKSVWNVEMDASIPKTAVLTSPTCTTTECSLGSQTMEKRCVTDHLLFLNTSHDIFNVEPSLIRNIVEEIWQFEPEILLVNPVYLAQILIAIKRFGLKLPPVKLVLTTYQYASGIHHRLISEQLHCPVYNTYTATELAGSMIGVQCAKGQMHVREDQTLVDYSDVLDESIGVPLHRIRVSTFSNRVSPLIRYELGDLVSPLTTDCSCVLSDWPCFEFHGRESECIRTPNAILSTKMIDDIVSESEGIHFYQCVQISENAVRIDIILNPDISLTDKLLVRDMRDRLGLDSVEIRIVSELRPAASLKYPLVVPT